MKVTVVYDNNAEKGLESGWGFSCLIECDKNILFDCGDKGKPLMKNFEKLGIDPASLDMIVLSHEHWDHTGGLEDVLKKAGDVRVVVPSSFSDEAKEDIRSKAELLEVKAMEKLAEGVWTTGELESRSRPNEQSLALETHKGILVITGCAHPGIPAILDSARKAGKLYGVMGGFHGFSEFGKLRGLEMISPCHCTQHSEEIRDHYPNEYFEIKAGSVLEL